MVRPYARLGTSKPRRDTERSIKLELAWPDFIRFIRKFSRLPGQGPKGDCWEWIAGRFPEGYGSFWLVDRSYGAHRIAFWIETGRWPEALICHRCDNPPCVRPSHLFEGTEADNSADMAMKGRAARFTGDSHPSHKYPERVPRGEEHHAATLTTQTVLNIRALYAAGNLQQKEIAKQFGLDPRLVGKIVRRERWVHI